ncbi:MAG: M20/M25/M40 family metallo-hydrolase [Acidimicrobiaceae bacterium]|nr:M20/M25/M40 family metallo-hydrolase [Acidimicrobiaceae bacterium]HAY68102.1 peptidase M20 family protein [Acidimicrobiaceae bacterium]
MLVGNEQEPAVGKSIDVLTQETVELLQQMIRNQCVNHGTPESGNEDRNARLLRDELEGIGVDFEVIEPAPGRSSMIARYEGTDPNAPSLCLMGHTDVVPVSPDGWMHDPFGGELITADDGTPEVWGRGAVDMLNLTSSMMVAFREIVRSGKRYPGDLIYFAVADEEAGGALGAKEIVDNHWDAIKCDYVLTENGGITTSTADGTTVMMTTGEKKGAFRHLEISGEPGHGSRPYRSDNALVKAAKIVTRMTEYEIAPKLDDMFRERVRALGLGAEMEDKLLDPDQVDAALASLPRGTASNLHSCCQMSFSPNMVNSGEKANTVPDRADLYVDIRVLPSETQDDADRHLRAIIGEDLLPSVKINRLFDSPDGPSMSSTDTPLWSALTDSVQMAYPTARVVPSMVTGGTDARFFRAKGVPAYGAGLLSNKVSFAEFGSRFHGHNERIDVESLKLTTELWLNVCNRLWA